MAASTQATEKADEVEVEQQQDDARLLVAGDQVDMDPRRVASIVSVRTLVTAYKALDAKTARSR